MSKNSEDSIKVDGIVVETLPALSFKVELPSGKFIHASLSGKLRRSRRESLRIIRGDKVTVEMSIHDLSIGRITYRYPRERVKINNI